MRQQYCPMCQTSLGTSLTSCPCGWRMLDPMPRQNVTLPPPIGFVPQVEHDRLMAAARDVVLAYLEANPMRTADIHPASCGCLRCEIDRLGNACGRDPCEAPVTQ